MSTTTDERTPDSGPEEEARPEDPAPVGALELAGGDAGDRREVAGDERQHAGGEERDHAGGKGSENAHPCSGIAAYLGDRHDLSGYLDWPR